MEEERILLGGWLLGYHLEDMAYMEPEDFQQPGIFTPRRKECTGYQQRNARPDCRTCENAERVFRSVLQADI